MSFVKVQPLKECYGWRGKTYLPGSTEVPADLANALGLLSGAVDNMTGIPVADVPNPALAQAAAEALQRTAIDRQYELQALYDSEGWDAIKAIAEPLGITKPAEGWKHAIPLIVEAEFA